MLTSEIFLDLETPLELKWLNKVQNDCRKASGVGAVQGRAPGCVGCISYKLRLTLMN